MITYSLDACSVHDHQNITQLIINGWAFSSEEDKRLKQLTLVFVTPKHKYSLSTIFPYPRHDVYQQFQREDALFSGFKATVGIRFSDDIDLYLDCLLSNGQKSRIHIKQFKANGSTTKAISHYPCQQHSFFERLKRPAPIYHIDKPVKYNKPYLPDFTSPSPSNNFIPKQPIDIIIPIYKNLQLVKQLLQSVIKNTKTAYRLILVDDCSQLSELSDYLSDFCSKHANCLLLENPQNLGFVKSVNKAVAHTKNHFVLLNSDTEVPPHWLSRLITPILRDSSIASVTPFTNDGHLFSFPEFMVSNKLLLSHTCEEIDRFFQGMTISTSSQMIHLPTGTGFCMAFNKKVVNKIGMFDEDTYEKGYGEENDWCQRARMYGYHHVLAHNLFVYHFHGASFGSEEKKRLQEQNLIKLKQRYPTYDDYIAEAFREDAAKLIRFIMTIKILQEAAETNNLIFNHNLGGGATIYLDQIIKEKLAANCLVLLLVFDHQEYQYKCRLQYQNEDILFRFQSLEEFRLVCNYLELDEIFINELVTFPEVPNWLDLIANLAQKETTKLTIPIHDFYCICPKVNLLNQRNCYCHIPSFDDCKYCLIMSETPQRDIEQWRQIWGQVLSLAKSIICFSNDSKKQLEKAYPNQPMQIDIKPHKSKAIINKPLLIPEHDSINICVLGHMAIHKGYQVICNLIETLSINNLHNIKLVMFGNVEFEKQHDFVTVHGKYNKSELAELMVNYQIDTVLIPSICPETFSFTTDEAMSLNLPTAVFNLGAPAERIKSYSKGIIIKSTAAEDIILTISRYIKQQKEENKHTPT